MEDTEADFKELTGTGLDEGDAIGIVAIIDEEEVVDDEVDPLKGGSLLGGDDEASEEEHDEMLDYIYGDQLNSR